MRQYIEDLTNQLIGASRFDAIRQVIKGDEDFVNHVKLSLEGGAVRVMKPETLGKIMCSLEIGDVMAGKADLMNKVCFAGEGDEMLRSMVATCLAYAIRERLDSTCIASAPPYRTVKREQLS